MLFKFSDETSSEAETVIQSTSLKINTPGGRVDESVMKFMT